MLNRKFNVVICSIMFMLLLTACAPGGVKDVESSTEVNNIKTKSVNGWGITVINHEITDDLSTTKSAIQYDGSSLDVSLNEKPSTGNNFILMEMLIEKEVAGSDSFKWEYAFILDERGQKYYRHANDTFLENFNFPRIKSINLTFGKNEGFVCYELPIEATKEILYFVYESPKDRIQIKIN